MHHSDPERMTMNDKTMAVQAPGTLRGLIGAEDGLLLPGVANALTARIAEDLGFRAVYVTGAGVTNTFFGLPDIGLLTLTELAAHVRAISDAVSVPILVDADTGFGNAVTVARTVRLLESAGASGIQIEDQVAPKRCGHFDDQEVIALAEMRQKIRAATESRRSAETLIVARTDARAAHGIDEALERAAAYAAAGADVLFIEGLHSRDELVAAGAAVPGVPKTPLLPRDELLSMGYSVLLYANAALQGAIHGTQAVLVGLRDAGSLDPVRNKLAPWDERQRLVRRKEFDELEQHYRAG
jgi:2-methylisocitrate lyase-like PEP mutase family enzyme